MKYIVLNITLLFSFIAGAQDFYYTGYDWLSTPEKYELTEEEQKMDEIFLKRKDCVQMVVKGDDALEFRLAHKIIRLNTDLGIERFNKWYLTNYGAIEMRFQKARVIKPNGEIVVQNASDIKESKGEDGEVEYRYFAFEGIEKGSTIELLELGLFPARLSGGEIKLQGSSHFKSVEFEIITPDFLAYATYPVNGAPNLVMDSSAHDGYRRLYVTAKDMKQLKEEEWAAYGANLKKVYYKFDKNLNSKKGNFYSYSDVTHNIHQSLFAPMNKKEAARLKKFMKSLNLTALTEEDKIRAIENELKHGYYIVEQFIENGTTIDFILQNKIMSSAGYYRILMNCFNELNIPFEMVLTCDRFEDKFLTKYEAYNFLSEYLMYIPSHNKYISEALMSRYGFPPDELTFQKGLFIRELKVQNIATGVGEIKDISHTKGSESVDKLNIKLSLVGDSEVKIDAERITTGYKAIYYQVPLDYMIEDQKKEVKEEYITYIDNGATVENMTFENDKTTSFGKAPLIGRGTFTSKNFIEKGGDKLLLKAGMLIGPQSELYNREARVLPVETPHTREYDRDVEIEIPSGYEIKNLEDLVINVVPFGEKGNIGFVSSYTIEGNTLKIKVKEWYNALYFEASDYKSYENVINAAADFNKIILVLQPK